MPLVRISTAKPKSSRDLRAFADGVHAALVAAIGIPADDRFQVLAANEELIFDRNYLGIARSDDAVFIHVTLVRGRPVEKKQALYRAIVENLARAGVRPEDVVITLVENERSDWSVGNGVAQLLG